MADRNQRQWLLLPSELGQKVPAGQVRAEGAAISEASRGAHARSLAFRKYKAGKIICSFETCFSHPAIVFSELFSLRWLPDPPCPSTMLHIPREHHFPLLLFTTVHVCPWPSFPLYRSELFFFFSLIRQASSLQLEQAQGVIQKS